MKPDMIAHLVISLCLVLVFGLSAGCSGGPPDDAPLRSRKDVKGPVRGALSIWIVTPEGRANQWWDRLIHAFEKRYPEAEIDLTRYSTEDYYAKQLAAFSSGEEPEISEFPDGELLNRYVRAGKIAPLNGLVDLRRFTPTMVERFKAPNGRIYGVPEAPFIFAMYYNRDRFAKVDLQPPKTWRQLIAACKTLRADGVTPIALGNGGGDQWTAQFYFESLLYQYGGARAAVDATYGFDGAAWTGAPVVNAATRLTELVEAGCFPPGFTGLNYTQMSSLFARGQASMILDSPILASTLDGIGFDAGIFPVPDAEDAVNSTASLEGIVGGVTGLAASRKAMDENPALVVAFLNAFAAVADNYAVASRQPSAVRDATRPDNPLLAAASSMMNRARELTPAVDTAVGSAIHDDYFQNLYSLTAGDLTPEQFAEAMQKAVEAEKDDLPELSETGS